MQPYKQPINIIGTDATFHGSLTVKPLQEGISLVFIQIEANQKAHPPIIRVEWSHPAVDIHAMWHPGNARNKNLQVDWDGRFQSKSTTLAPITTLYNLNGQNRLTFACSDALSPITVKAGIHEEDSTFLCSITFFEEPMPKIDKYEAVLRIDTRDIPYYESIRDVQAWWETFPGLEPAYVPEIALKPMYSTWYSFHQALDARAVEDQCKLAKSLGCEAVIVDDGWQTDDNNRGYAYTGDWEVAPKKMGDMRAHVDAVHQHGMQYLLWYSVPFVGNKSRVWKRFENKFLYSIESLETNVLDPRFPDVREYLIGLYTAAVRDWGIDGLKLDFVDSFSLSKDKRDELGGGRDYDSVPEAVDRLLTDAMLQLRAIKPDILIEFRQSYIGPLMRKYGNIFRASDCPNDAIDNRIRTLDLRLMSGNTAVHADMIMFNPAEPVESAAMQLINVLFSVPQISVMLQEADSPHMRMLRFWLAFCMEHQEVLLKGDLAPTQPEMLYPLVKASLPDKQVAVVYSQVVIPLVGAPVEQLILVNGTYQDSIVVKMHEGWGLYSADVRNCLGEQVCMETIELASGLHEIKVPKAGVVFLKRT
ncbi:MAG: alpha-galactosidase [Gorillibacterium sp.]|nr:alpha-galactosidase [Gorillibacterium sp.]